MKVDSYNAVVFAIHDNNRTIGMVTLTPQGEVRDLLITEAYRGKHLAYDLMRSLLTFAANNFPPDAVIWGVSAEDNKITENFITKYGWPKSAIYKGMVADIPELLDLTSDKGGDNG